MTRALVVVFLLALVIGCLALMMQATLTSQQQVAALEGRVRTLIELREAGAFGTGGFGGDNPIGEEHFSVDTLEKVWRIPSAPHLARVDDYVYKPEIDPAKRNAYAMVIGLRPGAALRAIGEIDYEHARIITGRSFGFARICSGPSASTPWAFPLRRVAGCTPPSPLPPWRRVPWGFC